MEQEETSLDRLISSTRKRADKLRQRIDARRPGLSDDGRHVSELIGRFSELDKMRHELEILKIQQGE